MSSVANGILENIEEVLMELSSFEKKVTRDDCAEIPQILDDYLLFVARTGNTHFPWMKIKPLFRSKLERVIREFSQKSEEIPPTPNVDPFQFEVVRDTVFEQLEFFAGIPFTVQRLCELLTAPSKHYKRTDKFMRALEKNMLVVSTIEAVHPSPLPPLGVHNGLSDTSSSSSFSSTLEQRESEAAAAAAASHLHNGSSPSPLASSMSSSDEEEKDCLKSDETGIYSPPVSNGNSSSQQTPDEHLPVNGGNAGSSDLETSGPCDSGESSSSENSSPNPHFSDSSTPSTNNEAAVSSGEKTLKEEDELTDELLPLTDSMEIDSECSSSDNLLIETSSAGIRREEIQDEVQSTEEETPQEQPSAKKQKMDEEDGGNSDSSSSKESGRDQEEAEEEESSSPSSSKDDELTTTAGEKGPDSRGSDSCVSTSEDTTPENNNEEDSSNEATPSTTSADDDKPKESSSSEEPIDSTPSST